MEKQKGPVISFRGYRISKLHYDTISQDDFDEKFKHETTKMKISGGVNADQNIGTVRIVTDFINENVGYRKCHLEIDGSFSIRKDIDHEQAKKYIATNGAAMLYPYVRTIVSMITSLDDQKVTVLPSLNFLEQFNKNQSKNDKK